ncbi:MAG: hypothetical protein WCC36_16030 [Gammaproteobacteria bacterium]
MNHPPRNRSDTPLPAHQIEIEDRQGRVRSASGDALLVAAAGDYGGIKPLDIGQPGPLSVLCGEPGYLYRSADVQIPLTRDELLRLVFSALTADEYFKLREIYGQFREIDTDCYDPETGAARQPKVRVPTVRP